MQYDHEEYADEQLIASRTVKPGVEGSPSILAH